jgi:SsrA-binding protein
MGNIVTNPKARRDYHILETLEAGIVLRGTEVKSLRAGQGQIGDAFVRIEHGEAFLHNAHIEEYAQGHRANHQPLATRKLLLHHAEIRKLSELTSVKGHALVPLALYWKEGRVKVQLAVAKGKREFDKREAIKERETERELKRLKMHHLKGVARGRA